MTTAQLRNAAINLPAQAEVLIRLPDGQIVRIVGYTTEKATIVLETVLPEDEQK